MGKKIISVLNQKGGVGKTTTVINLASFLAKSNKKVLVVDFDPQANATSGLGVDKNNLESTVYDVLVSGKSIIDSIKSTGIKNVSLLPTDARLASAEIEISSRSGREGVLRDELAKIGDFDYILIDCPPSLGLLTINALTASDSVIVPVQAEYYALEGLSQLLQVMGVVQKNYNPELKLLGVIVTMFDKRNSLSRQVYEEVKKHFEDKVFTTTIPRNVRLAEAPSYGMPIDQYDKWSKGAKAYKSLAKEISASF